MPERSAGFVRTGLGLFAFVIVAQIAYTLALGWPPFTTDDSSGYLEWSPIRSPGYPAFLSLTRPMTLGQPLFHILQAAMLIGAVIFLAWALHRLTGRKGLAIAFGVVVLAMTALWKWSAQVRPECAFVALSLVCFGAVIMAVARRSSRWAALAGLALAVAVLVRPAGLAFVPALLFLAVALWRLRGLPPALALLVPLALILGLTIAGNGIVRGYYALQTFGGLSLFGKTASLLPPGGFGDDLSRSMAERVAPLHARIGDAHGDALYWLSRQGYDMALWDNFIPYAQEHRMDMVTSDALARDISERLVRDNPAGYARLVAIHWLGMWTWTWISTSDRVAESRALIAEPALNAFLGRKAKLSDLQVVPSPIFWAKIAFAALACLVCTAAAIGGLATLWRGLDPLWIVAGAGGIAVHGYAFLVSTVQFADNRYATAVLPILALTVALTVAAALGRDTRG